MEAFNASAARALVARAKQEKPTKQLTAIKEAAQKGFTEAWFTDLSSVTIDGLRALGFTVESLPDRNETANKVSW